MKTYRCVLALLVAPALLPAATPPALDPALEDREWLVEALLYSYYWYLDDAFFAATAGSKEVEVWLRSTEPHVRDAGDHSRFGEIWLAPAKVLLTVKKADYFIPELGQAVRNQGYRVARGSFESAAPGAPADWKVLVLDRDQVINTLKSARHKVHVPGPETKEIILHLLRQEMRQAGITQGEQKFFLAARTAVANDVWVYWVDRRMILQVSGDMEISAAAVLAHRPMLVRRYDLGTNVVASLLETGGSNAVISRDWASRVLFMCLARGEAINLHPAP
jgi:hypothetical protein